jgi:hypothetical protein
MPEGTRERYKENDAITTGDCWFEAVAAVTSQECGPEDRPFRLK